MRDAARRLGMLAALFAVAAGVVLFVVRHPRGMGLRGLLAGEAARPTRAEPFTPADPVISAEDIPFLARLDEEYARLMAAVVPAVVAINTSTEARRGDEPFGRFYQHQAPALAGLGSGVIISREGHIVTSHHVVAHGEEMVDRIVVTLHGGRSYGARVLGYNRGVDIAVLRIESDRTDFPALQFADSERVRVGQLVFAVGNPFGLTETVTPGIISAKERRLSDASAALLQTNAMINPGSSGGPLVDVWGRIVGINRLIFTARQDLQLWQGVGLAIPASDAREVVEAVLEQGVPVWGFLGIACDNLDPVTAMRLGVKSSEGAYITDVLRDSPASAAGLQPDDVVVRYDRKVIREKTELIRRILRSETGKRVEILVKREGRELSLVAVVGDYEDYRHRTEQDEQWSHPDTPEAQEILRWAGLAVRDLSETERQRIPPPAVLVTRVRGDSTAAAVRILPGSLIHAVDGTPVASAEQFQRLLRNASGRTARLSVTTRTGQQGVVELKLPIISEPGPKTGEETAAADGVRKAPGASP
ncbi:MAG TPA: trypsin-like peptidase domain-containing protein [Verrucomicrobiales bacterium]|nr:trypsin-like peptidase domain-containing protein [Verrucomicrobiales bacterium]